MAWSALGRSQPWLASTRRETSDPTASRSRRTLSTSWATGCGRLDLEDAVAERDLRASLRDLRVRALDGERPRQRHALAHAPPEQAVHGNAERLAVEIPERHLDGGAREGVALYPSRHLAVQRLDPGCVATDEPRRDVALDRDRDRFRGLLAPRGPAQARGLSPAREAVRRLDAHEGEIDRLEGREGHLVRALHGNVGEGHPDVGDLHGFTRRRGSLRERRPRGRTDPDRRARDRATACRRAAIPRRSGRWPANAGSRGRRTRRPGRNLRRPTPTR